MIFIVFFFKQKTAYEMRISDWSSDVCSSDLIQVIPLFPQYASASTGSVHQKVMEILSKWQVIPQVSFANSFHDHPAIIKIFADNGRKHGVDHFDKIGRASCRERVCTYV